MTEITYVSRRSDLVKKGILIPCFTNWDRMIEGEEYQPARDNPEAMTLVEQNEWIRTFGQDDEGHVFTPVGIFLSIDLDFEVLETPPTQHDVAS